jgi:hypothetical protein
MVCRRGATPAAAPHRLAIEEQGQGVGWWWMSTGWRCAVREWMVRCARMNQPAARSLGTAALTPLELGLKSGLFAQSLSNPLNATAGCCMAGGTCWQCCCVTTGCTTPGISTKNRGPGAIPAGTCASTCLPSGAATAIWPCTTWDDHVNHRSRQRTRCDRDIHLHPDWLSGLLAQVWGHCDSHHGSNTWGCDLGRYLRSACARTVTCN